MSRENKRSIDSILAGSKYENFVEEYSGLKVGDKVAYKDVFGKQVIATFKGVMLKCRVTTDYDYQTHIYIYKYWDLAILDDGTRYYNLNIEQYELSKV